MKDHAALIPGLDVKVGQAPPYAWPGGYPIGYICDDGELLCAACVNDPSNPIWISDGFQSGDGWGIVGIEILEGSALDYDGPVLCAHCAAVLVEEEEPDTDAQRVTPDDIAALEHEAGFDQQADERAAAIDILTRRGEPTQESPR